MRGNRIVWMLVCCGGVVAVNPPAALAQRGLPFSPRGSAKLNAASSAARKQRDEAEKLMKAKRELSQQEVAAISAAMQQVADAKAALRSAAKESKETKDKVSDRIEDSLGLRSALADLAAAQTAYRHETEPVLKALKPTDEYHKAETQAAAAKAAMTGIRDDQSLDDAARQSKLAEHMGDSLAVANLERITLAKNASVGTAREAMETAQQKVADLRKKAKGQIEKDSSIKAGEQAVDSAQAAVKSAEANLASIQTQAASAERMLQAGIVPKAGDKDGQGKGNADGKTPKKK